MTLEKINLLGALTALTYFTSMILIFVLRLVGKPQWGSYLGLLQTLIAIPLAAALLFTARRFHRPSLYLIQAALFLAFLVVELLIDFIFKIDFRQTRWMVISFVTFFFAATGGMIGIASQAGRGWTVAAVIIYLVMAALAFIQRAVTGL